MNLFCWTDCAIDIEHGNVYVDFDKLIIVNALLLKKAINILHSSFSDG